MTEIGPDFNFGDNFGDRVKWDRGAITDSGIIYCPPVDSRRRGILKIDTNTDNVTELDRNLLPERGNDMWVSCAAALDGCIYFMPYYAIQIMKLDPTMSAPSPKSSPTLDIASLLFGSSFIIRRA